MPEQVDRILNRTQSIRALILADVARATPAELAHKPGTRWSARDVLIHMGNWEEQAAVWLGNLLRGEPMQTEEQLPIDEWNARHLAKYADLDGAGASAYFQRVAAELDGLTAQVTDAQLQADRNFLGLLLMTPDHEIGHLHQLRETLAVARGEAGAAAVESFRYTRQRVLTRLNLEHRPAAALEWRPAPETWSVKEILIHLAVWDRGAAGVFAALADGEPLPAAPFPEGGLDAFNQETVRQAAWMSLADVLAELGGARADLERAMLRLTPAQWAGPEAQGWLGYREHDDHHMHKILETLTAWRQTQQ